MADNQNPHSGTHFTHWEKMTSKGLPFLDVKETIAKQKLNLAVLLRDNKED